MPKIHLEFQAKGMWVLFSCFLNMTMIASDVNLRWQQYKSGKKKEKNYEFLEKREDLNFLLNFLFQ